MAKTAGKSAARKSSTSKKRDRKRRSGGPQADPPIIIKSGGLPGDDAEGGFSMEMDCKSPMDFSFDPTKVLPNQYYYPDMTVGEINQVVITKDGIVVFAEKLAGSVWQIELSES
jgi:hypothetical protein